jgi:hypothetical protein
VQLDALIVTSPPISRTILSSNSCGTPRFFCRRRLTATVKSSPQPRGKERK